MNKQPKDISRFLPTGEMLRGLMEQPFIQKSDLKELLRSRGVFTCHTEKRDSIPILMTTILSPVEFDNLRECQSSREDNPKRITQTIPWSSEKNLLEALPENFNVGKNMEAEFSGYKIGGAPDFIPVNNDPNHLRLDFEVEREDLAKNWASNKNVFPGSIEAKRVFDGAEVKIVITHTANETKKAATNATKALVSGYKEKGYIKRESEIQKITYDRFTNSNRIQFFLELSVEVTSNVIDFIEIVDIELSPDHEANLPDEMKWMSNKIDDLKLNGKLLHETFFVNEKSNHKHIFLYRLDVRYGFDISGAVGTCVITLKFPEYSKSKSINSELEITVKSINPDSPLRGITKSQVKEKLLDEMEIQKLEKFRNYTSE